MSLIRFLVKMFPTGWRARYEEEFIAVIEQSGIRATDYVNIMMAALDARLHPELYTKGQDRHEEVKAMVTDYRRQMLGARWSARVLGFLASGFFLMFFIGEGIPDIINGKGIHSELLPFLPLLGLALVGYLYAWFSERIGGLMLVLGGLSMGSYLLINGGMKDLVPALIYCLPFLIPGVLFLVSGSRFNKITPT